MSPKRKGTLVGHPGERHQKTKQQLSHRNRDPWPMPAGHHTQTELRNHQGEEEQSLTSKETKGFQLSPP